MNHLPEMSDRLTASCDRYTILVAQLEPCPSPAVVAELHAAALTHLCNAASAYAALRLLRGDTRVRVSFVEYGSADMPN